VAPQWFKLDGPDKKSHYACEALFQDTKPGLRVEVLHGPSTGRVHFHPASFT
jgi:hypothetical protein